MVLPDRLRVGTGGTHRLCQCHPVDIGQPPGGLGVDRTAHQFRPQARHPEAGALLVHVVDDGEGTPTGQRPTPLRGRQCVYRQEPEDDTERAVPQSTVGHGVQVGTGGDGTGRRLTPPGPDIAVDVGGDVHPPGLGLAGEPGAQCCVLLGPGEAAHAGLPHTDGVELAPHGAEGLHQCGHVDLGGDGIGGGFLMLVHGRMSLLS